MTMLNRGVRGMTTTLLLLLVQALTTTAAATSLSAGDREAVRRVGVSLEKGWQRNDKEAVMALFAANAVLLPHHGDPPVVGAAAIRKFWWPAAPAVGRVTLFSQTYDEIGGEGGLAFMRGTFELAYEWTQEGKAHRYHNRGTYLMLCRRTPAGIWLITHRMWDDPVGEVT